MSRSETEKERVLLVHQTNAEVVAGRFPVSRDLAVELAAVMAQVTAILIDVCNYRRTLPLIYVAVMSFQSVCGFVKSLCVHAIKMLIYERGYKAGTFNNIAICAVLKLTTILMYIVLEERYGGTYYCLCTPVSCFCEFLILVHAFLLN